MARWLILLTLAVVGLTLPALVPVAEPASNTTFSTRGLSAGDASTPAPALFASEVTVATGAEPSIVVDKLGRAILIGDHEGVSRSTNGGLSWARSTPPWIPGNHPFVGGIYDGWALAQDDAGTIYASTTDGPVINVASSIDGGATWQLGASTFLVDASPLIADRPWLAARGNGIVAVTWNDGGTAQRCALSTDGALTFPTRTPPLVSAPAPIGGLPDFDSAGKFIFAGDGGIGGGASRLYRYNGANPCAGLQGLAIPAHGDQLSTAVTVDSADKIYLATPTTSEDGMQLIGFNGYTTTGVKSLIVSSPTLKANTFGTVASYGDQIAVAWYATTTSGNFQDPSFNGAWDVYVARVTNFWTATPSITVTKVTTTPNHVGDMCLQGTNCDLSGNGDRDLLDYFTIAYDTSGNLHVAYAHDGTGDIAEVRYSMLAAI